MSQALVRNDRTPANHCNVPPCTPVLKAVPGNDFLARITSTLPTTNVARTTRVTPSLLRLSHELRLQIYDLVISAPMGVHRVRLDGGRSLYRVDWTTTSKMREDHIYHYPATHAIQVLMSVCRTMRLELLPLFLRDRIVKFPAWNPDFKLQSLFWMEGFSETFVRGCEWWWFEGVYWRFSLHLPNVSMEPSDLCSDEKTTAAWARKVERFWEDEMASGMGVCKYADAAWYVGDGFVLRVDYAKQMERSAFKAGEELAACLEVMMGRKGEGERLGRADLRGLLARARLCAGEQLGARL